MTNQHCESGSELILTVDSSLKAQQRLFETWTRLGHGPFVLRKWDYCFFDRDAARLRAFCGLLVSKGFNYGSVKRDCGTSDVPGWVVSVSEVAQHTPETLSQRIGGLNELVAQNRIEIFCEYGEKKPPTRAQQAGNWPDLWNAGMAREAAKLKAVVTLMAADPAPSAKPKVEMPDIPTVKEILAVKEVDARHTPLTYSFTFYDPDLPQLSALLQNVERDGFVFETLEPASLAFQKIYGRGCWAMRVGITGLFPTSKLRSLAKRFCQAVVTDHVWALFTTVAVRVPDRNGRRQNRAKLWEQEVAKGKKQIKRDAAKHGDFASQKLDGFYKQPIPAKGSPLSAWQPFISIPLKGEVFVLTDMRPGPSEDEFPITLESNEYCLELRLLATGSRVAGLRVIRPGLSTARGKQLGTISTDMATLGIYERKSMQALLRKGREAFFEWGESALGHEGKPYGVLVHDAKKGSILPYVQSGFGDGTFPVFELLKDGQRVGFEVEFISDASVKAGQPQAVLD